MVIRCCVCHHAIGDLNLAKWMDGLAWANWFAAGATQRPAPRKALGWAHIDCANEVDTENALKGY